MLHLHNCDIIAQCAHRTVAKEDASFLAEDILQCQEFFSYCNEFSGIAIIRSLGLYVKNWREPISDQYLASAVVSKWPRANVIYSSQLSSYSLKFIAAIIWLDDTGTGTANSYFFRTGTGVDRWIPVQTGAIPAWIWPDFGPLPVLVPVAALFSGPERYRYRFSPVGPAGLTGPDRYRFHLWVHESIASANSI